MKKFVKILSLVLVFALSLAPVAMAAGLFTPPENSSVEGLTEIQEFTGTIVTILQYVGYAVAIVMVLWLGIQWMIAQPAKKAELKGKMWSMAIGILLLVGGVTILGIVWDTFKSGVNG